MNNPTKPELADADHDAWVDWLFGALRAYTANVPAARRVRAFAPLHIDPESQSPVGEFMREIERLPGQPLAAVGKAAVEVTRLWSPTIDPWRGGALALQIATRAGGRNLFDATKTLLAKSTTLPLAARESLAFLAGKAAEARFLRSEVEQLSRLLWKMELLTPSLLGDLTLLVAREDFNGLEGLPGTLLALAPGIIAPPHDGKYAAAIANRICEHYPIEQIQHGLGPNRDDTEDEAKVRDVLAQLAVPWVVTTSPTRRRADGNAQLVAKEIMDRKRLSLESLGDELPKGNVVQLRSSE